MNCALDQSHSAELERIARVYAGRGESSRYTFADPSFLLAVQERGKKLLQLILDRGYSSLDHLKILEVGCGTGAWLRDFICWGAKPENVWGVDLLPARIAQARDLCPAGVTLECRDATRLDSPDGSFDLVLQSTVFTSILSTEMRYLLAREMLRVIGKMGLILWYDFRINNPANPNVRGIGRKEIAGLFPDCNISLHRLTLAPPIGHTVAPFSASLYRAMSSIKPLCTHYLGAISKQ